MGKAGHRAVTDFWLGDPSSFGSEEDRAEYVSDILKRSRFVYKYPDESVSHSHFLEQLGFTLTLVFQLGQRAAFCSALISKVYAKHLRRILPDDRIIPQVGGLALATVAVCPVFFYFDPPHAEKLI